jgi:hypothetical protein
LDRVSWASPTIDGITEDSGLRGDFITADPSIVVRGTGMPGGTVDVSLATESGAVVLPATTTAVSPQGGWTFGLPVLADGHYTLRASTAGGVVEQVLVIDRLPPQGPVTVDSQTIERLRH